MNLLESDKTIETETMKRWLESFPPLLRVVANLIKDEWVESSSLQAGKEFSTKKFVDVVPHLRSCNVCHCDIFNRCFHKRPGNKERKPSEWEVEAWEDELDYCIDCLAEMRANYQVHVKVLVDLCEYFPRKELVRNYRSAILVYRRVLLLYITRLQNEGRELDLTADYLHQVPSQDLFDAFSVHDTPTPATRAWQNFARAVSCHSCHVKKKEDKLIRCSNKKKTGYCKKVYCERCLKRYWDKDITELKKQKKLDLLFL